MILFCSCTIVFPELFRRHSDYAAEVAAECSLVFKAHHVADVLYVEVGTRRQELLGLGNDKIGDPCACTLSCDVVYYLREIFGSKA